MTEIIAAAILAIPAFLAWMESRRVHACLDDHVRKTAEHHRMVPSPKETP